jgi:maltose alpha-D-glucosyltransferase/alpha-amylase
MLDGDEARLRSVYSLTLALPGAPILFYGEEIGMGARLDLEGRMSVRTPMQWSDARNAGFSCADADALVRPIVDDGPLAYERVNVERQEDEAGSLLHWMRRAVTTRRQCPEVGFGTCTVLELDEPTALGLRYDWRGGTVVTVHNLSSEPSEPRLSARSRLGRLSEILGDQTYPPVGRNGRCALDRYGFRWFRAHGAAP